MIACTQKHTHCQVAQTDNETKTWQRVCFYQSKKKFIFFLPTLRCCNFFANAQPKTDKHIDSSERKQKVVDIDSGDRTPSANMRLASCGVKWLNSSSVFQINFSAWLTVRSC